MKMLRYVATSLAIAMLATIGSSQYASAQETDNTPLTCESDSLKIAIENDKYLLSHDEGGAFMGPVPVDIPAGRYDIVVESYDDHTHKAGQIQNQEQWYFEGWYEGELVFTSNTTKDIPADSDYVASVLGENIQVPQIDQIRYIHAAYPDPSYQSVIPMCVHFQESQVVESHPVCERPDGVITLHQEQVLLSHDEGGAYIGPVAVEIPAGTYDISALSFDHHSTAYNDPLQTQEQWYFEGWYEGELVYTSSTTDDIPSESDTIETALGVSVPLPAIDSIRYVHAAHPNPLYHSVHPSCLHFSAVTVQDDIGDEDGEVLGSTDGGDQANDDTASLQDNDEAKGGDDLAVLGASDTLAATGTKAFIGVLTGVTIVAASLVAAKRTPALQPHNTTTKKSK